MRHIGAHGDQIQIPTST